MGSGMEAALHETDDKLEQSLMELASLVSPSDGGQELPPAATVGGQAAATEGAVLGAAATGGDLSADSGMVDRPDGSSSGTSDPSEHGQAAVASEGAADGERAALSSDETRPSSPIGGTPVVLGGKVQPVPVRSGVRGQRVTRPLRKHQTVEED